MKMQGCAYAPNYRLTSTERTTEDGITYTSYGIECVREHTPTGEEAVRAIADISSNPELVDGMINLFNLCHLAVDCFPPAVLNLIS